MTKINEEIEEPSQLEVLNSLIEKGTISSESLCAQIVAYRTLGMGKEIAAKCMIELATRRTKGDDFNFEKFIDDEVAKIPKIPAFDFKQLTGNFSIQALTKMMQKKK